MSFTTSIQNKLIQVFADHQMILDVHNDYFVVQNSQNVTDEKIQKIIESAGFSPLTSKNKLDSNFTFTIAPFKSTDNSPYFTKEEISSLLKEFTFKDLNKDFKDVWAPVNNTREHVSTAVNKGLSDLVEKHLKDKHPIVEIGSGIGYTLSERVSSQTIRIQPRFFECQLLCKTVSEPIYETDIEGLYNGLKASEKKIPLFFALDVFDTIPTEKRKASLSQISQLQSAGDHLLIISDTNPRLENVIEELELSHPDHIAYPYFPFTTKSVKLSFVMVPKKYIEGKLSTDAIHKIIQSEARLLSQGMASAQQVQIHELQEELNLKIEYLEDFYIDQIKKQLEEAGYTSKNYYHAGFTTGGIPEDLSKRLTEDLLYKSVTDTATLRQWSLTDKNFHVKLAEKGIALPDNFNEDFITNLRKNGQKISGAEFLVIEATKK